ncbi:hypothetical protein [Actinomadura fibrosa]|uniref:Uncharacterized protein n=1 Tax=Actinomadura fibrosa TaxID=111802 RepID=A0ABW2XD18_9ACTN|nr:hypothetical protein [Actinomadura fibrosa]
MSEPPDDTQRMVRARAPGIWSMLRRSVIKLGLEGAEQIKDPDVGECFEWDPGYPASWMCEQVGWISPELRSQLDELDALLDRLSADRRAWTDDAIMTLPLWEETRQVARRCLPLMTEEPWTEEVWYYE